jgi:Glu-tRNA(Gln) amidotransferase subunit E-like FAD-binding protein
LKGELNYHNLSIDSFKVDHMARFVNKLSSGEWAEDKMVQAIREVLEGKPFEEIIDSQDFKKLGKEDVFDISLAIAKKPKSLAAIEDSYRKESDKPLNAIVGDILKESAGKAEPKEVREIVYTMSVCLRKETPEDRQRMIDSGMGRCDFCGNPTSLSNLTVLPEKKVICSTCKKQQEGQ